MPVKRRKAKQRRAEVPADMIDFLSDREPENPWWYFSTDDEFRAAWTEVGAEILADWTADSPGTSPSFWWRFDAPRQPLGTFPDCRFDGKLPEPRQRLGGIGTPCNECLNYMPNYAFGLPTSFVSRWQESYYSGRSKDIDGEPIGEDYKEGDFAGVAIDPADPPQYESQASYLDRHDLFLPGEKARLCERDWQPEYVSSEDETEIPSDAA